MTNHTQALDLIDAVRRQCGVPKLSEEQAALEACEAIDFDVTRLWLLSLKHDWRISYQLEQIARNLRQARHGIVIAMEENENV